MRRSSNQNEVGVVQNHEVPPICPSYRDMVVIDAGMLCNNGVDEHGGTLFFNADWLVLAKSSMLNGYDAIFGMPGQSSVPVNEVCGGTQNINQGNVHAE
jgi:hypothetical protein